MTVIYSILTVEKGPRMRCTKIFGLLIFSIKTVFSYPLGYVTFNIGSATHPSHKATKRNSIVLLLWLEIGGMRGILTEDAPKQAQASELG